MFYIDIKKLNPEVRIPTKGSSESAGWDLYAYTYENHETNESDDWSVFLLPGQTVKIHTGLAISLPEGTFAGIYARSGLATKRGLAPANKVGIIDSDYRGEIIVALHNSSDIPQNLKKYERIAQLIIQPYITNQWIEVEELDETERGDGGFGSTGTN